MGSNSSEAGEGISFFLTEDDFLSFTKTTDNLHKTLKSISEVMQCRANIFLQKKEKHQQILDHQTMKLNDERNEYLKKFETLMNEIGDAKSNLMQIERSYFNLRNKLSLEKHAHQTLEERIKKLQLERKLKDTEFYKTSELFKAVLDKYQKHLNIEISLEQENPKVITVKFKETRKDFEGYPYIKLKLLENNKFQVLKMHPLLDEGNSITEQMILYHETTPLLNKFRRQFLEFTE